MVDRVPVIATVLEEMLKQRLTHIHTNLPAKVITYDATTQTATVLPVGKHRQPTETGAALVPYPPIENVPVCHPRWGSWFIHGPLAEGDYVDLVFGETSIDRWRELGDDSEDPVFDHRFDLSDAIAIPSNLYPVAQALTGLSASGIVIGKMGGVQVFFDEEGVLHLGSREASDPVVVAEKLIPILKSFVPALTSLASLLPLQATPISTLIPDPTALTTFNQVSGQTIAALTALRGLLEDLENLSVGSSIVVADP